MTLIRAKIKSRQEISPGNRKCTFKNSNQKEKPISSKEKTHDEK